MFFALSLRLALSSHAADGRLSLSQLISGPRRRHQPKREECMFSARMVRSRIAMAAATAALCVAWPARTIFSQSNGPSSQPPVPAAEPNVAQPATADANSGVEPLTSGPVHEA